MAVIAQTDRQERIENLMNQFVGIAFTAFAMHSHLQAQVAPAPDPIPFTSFQDNLWDDLWADDFVEGVDFLLSTQSLLLTTQSIHKIEWYPSIRNFESTSDSASITNLQTWNMDWFGYESAQWEIDSDDNGDPISWSSTIELSTTTFAGTISSDNSYSPHIYGLIQTITISESATSGGNIYTFHIWMPLGRGKLLEDVNSAAEYLSTEIFMPIPRTLGDDDCEAIEMSRWTDAATDLLNEKDDCYGFWPGLTRVGIGAGSGATVVGSATGIVFLFLPPAAAPAAGIGGIIGGVIGGISGPFVLKAKCIDNAYTKYKRERQRIYRCYLECLENGEWLCN